MKVVGSFNKISEKLRKELIPVVKPNEVIRFQRLDGVYEPAIQREGFGASKSIRLSDRIYDPYAKEVKDEKGNVKKNEKGEIEYEGEYVDIGVPDVIKEGRVERCKKYWVNSIANGIPGNGQFDFIGGNVEDMEIVEFLCLSNSNKDNPHRDKSKEPLWEKVNARAIMQREQEKEFKELQARLARISKDNPEKAAELAKMLPKEKVTS